MDWTPFSFKNSNNFYSLFLFPDDLLLFAKANLKTCNSIFKVLNNFSNTSGLDFHTKKSKVWFSPTVNTNMISTLSNTLGFRPCSELGTYLGIPLKPTYKISHFRFITDKINQKLHPWKANCLSQAGRTQSILSTTSNMATYYMSSLSLPKPILQDIYRINRNFFWNIHNASSHLFPISWEKISKL